MEDPPKLRRFWALRVVGMPRRIDRIRRQLDDRRPSEQPTPRWKNPGSVPRSSATRFR